MRQTAGTAGTAWLHGKSVLRTHGGMVVARHPLAADAGARILASGGNAVDCAVATALAIGVVQPFAATLGGGGLSVVHSPHAGDVAFDFRSRAAGSCAAGMYPQPDEPVHGVAGWSGVQGRQNEVGPRSCAVPGAATGLVLLHGRYGRLPLAEIARPAIDLAAGGHPIDWHSSMMQTIHLNDLRAEPVTAATFLRDGLPHRPRQLGPADTFRQLRLAGTLRLLGSEGAEPFCTGQIAQSVVGAVGPTGHIREADLAAYRVDVRSPGRTTYRGHCVLDAGHVSLAPLMLRILDRLPMRDLPESSPERVHLLVEVFRRCRGLERDHLGDFGQNDARWRHLTGAAFVTELAASIDLGRRSDDWLGLVPRAASDAAPPPGSESTASTVAADSDGMIVTLTDTILSPYGSTVTTESGILLNNAMFAFDLRPGMPNSIVPGGKPLSNMSPLIVFAPGGEPFCALGASGGRRISSAVTQVLSLMVDRGLSIQAAIDVPRVDVVGDTVVIGERFGRETISALERMGHEVVVVDDDLGSMDFANVGGVQFDAEGAFLSGADPLQQTSAAGV